MCPPKQCCCCGLFEGVRQWFAVLSVLAIFTSLLSLGSARWSAQILADCEPVRTAARTVRRTPEAREPEVRAPEKRAAGLWYAAPPRYIYTNGDIIGDTHINAVCEYGAASSKVYRLLAQTDFPGLANWSVAAAGCTGILPQAPTVGGPAISEAAGKLATISSLVEQEAVRAQCGNRICWLGLSDLAGQWRWADATPLDSNSYSSWAPGEPRTSDANGHLNSVAYMYNIVGTAMARPSTLVQVVHPLVPNLNQHEITIYDSFVLTCCPTGVLRSSPGRPRHMQLTDL